MKKKITATSILMAMAVSFMPYSIMAESSLTLKGFNATKSSVILDFNGVAANEYIDLEAAKENLVLEKQVKGGSSETVSDFEVIVQDTENLTATGQTAGNSIIIKPAGGVLSNALYKVTVAEGLEDTAGNTPADELSTGWFEVVELYATDFETGITSENKATVTPSAPYAWVYQGNATNGTPLISSEWTAGYRQDYTTIGDGSSSITNYNKFMLRNNGQYAYLNTTGLPTADRVADYTAELKLGVPNTTSGHAAVWMHYNRSGSSNQGYVLIFTPENYNNKKAKLTLRATGTVIKDISGYQLNDNQVDVRMTVNGDAVSCYVDDAKVFEETNKTSTTVNKTGGFAVTGTSAHNVSPHITFDDVSITKLVKYGETLPELTVKNVSVEGSGKVKLEFSEEIDEGAVLENYFELIDEAGEACAITAELDATDKKIVAVTAGEELQNGLYKLNVKTGLYSKKVAILKNTFQTVIKVEEGSLSKTTEYDKPVISNEQATVENKKLKIEFDYSGGEISSPYEIYKSDAVDGEYTLLESGVIETVPFEKTVGDEYKDCYIKIRIDSKNTGGYIGDIIWIKNVKGMFTPVIKSVTITDKFESGSVKINSCVVSDGNANDGVGYTIQWYQSEKPEEGYEPITGETSAELKITNNLRDRFVRAYITPTSNKYPTVGEVYKTPFYCRTFAPEALDVKITGEATLGEFLTGSYVYEDKNDPEKSGATESGTTIEWLKSDKKDGRYTSTGVTTNKYELTENDIDSFLIFRVTPRKTGWTGDVESGESEVFVCPARPVAKNVSISGTAQANYTLTGSYTYEQAHDIAEDKSNTLLEWYVDGSLKTTGEYYTVSASDVGKKIVFKVTPFAKKAPVEGETVPSEEVTVGSTASSAVTTVSRPSSTVSSVNSGSVIGGIMDTASGTENGQEFITSFTDIDDSPYKKEIVELYDMGIIKGITNTVFGPKKNLKRAEFVTLMVRTLGITPPEYRGIFADVFTGDWYAENIQAAHDYNLVSGYAGMFRPNDSIKREEIVKILIEAYEKKVGEITPEETEMKDVSEWAKVYADKAVAIELIGEKEFALNEFALREEAAALIYRFIEKVGEAR